MNEMSGLTENCKKAFDLLSIGVTIIDSENHVVFANQQAETIFSQYSRELETAIGERIYALKGTSLNQFFQSNTDLANALRQGDGHTKVQLDINGVTLQVGCRKLPEAGGVLVEWHCSEELTKLIDAHLQVAAMNRSQAVIEFDVNGKVLSANDNFCQAMGYQESEIVGNHHSMFVAQEYRGTSEYQQFWQSLSSGEFFSGEFERVAKDGSRVWIQASYNPIFDWQGKPVRVIKFASDITEQKNKFADYSGQLQAIARSQAVIEFDLDGKIITANENFLAVTGYQLDEVAGRHHSMFVSDRDRSSAEYKSFWRNLASGEYFSGEFKRIAKGGNEIWIQATYNPILGPDGKPFKVVKYATDITEEKLKATDFEGQLDAIGKSQAVIEFDMDGIVTHANDNFLQATGYSLSEIVGQHHRIFVPSDYASSSEYRMFWEKLKRGSFDAGEYQRVKRDGSDLWIQATYNPIFDLTGQPYKVVKYATDITLMKQAVSSIQRILSQVSEGDLTAKVDNIFEGDLGLLSDAANNLIQRLEQLVSEIRMASDSVFTASREIAQGNDDLSRRTESQAANLEETAAAMEELTSTVQQNASNASVAKNKAVEAMDNARAGGSVVESAVSAMQNISHTSKKIADIIGVIDEIAFQTNLLALNAAVEAARAGEQGRGFAVVAAEVRNLAQRSATAAKEIKGLINESLEAVESGSKLVNETGSTFGGLVESVTDIVDMVTNIDNASREQSTGIAEVSTSVGNMDEMTQQNAALVEEASASSRAMEEQAQVLLEQVSQFKLNGQSRLTEVKRPAAELLRKNSMPTPATTSAQSRPIPASRPMTVATPVSAPTPNTAVTSSLDDDDDEWEEF